jgi:hypothetical protein
MGKIKVGSDDGEGIEFEVSDDRIFVKGTWKGRTSKSKKGNFNMSWHSRELFDKTVRKYLGEEEY